MNRRDFLKLAGLGTVALAGCGFPKVVLPGDKVDKKKFNAYEFFTQGGGIDFENSLDFAKQIDMRKDKVLDVAPGLPRDELSLYMLASEIVPYFIYEGIVSERTCNERNVCRRTREIIPYMTYNRFDGMRNFHVMGTANCRIPDQNRSVMMNIRYGNPLSPRYDSPHFFSTLIHELAHVNGICGDDNYMESATQIATMEVLAAMVRHKNPHALGPFLLELQNFADDFALSVAINGGRMKRYREYVNDVADNYYDVAQFEKSMDYWFDNPVRLDYLKYILSAYGKVPYFLLYEAMVSPTHETKILESVPNLSKRIELDDTAYVLQNLDGLVSDYRELLR